ncbi:MAG: hypothetical protein EOP84_30455 [Verrucomicrobiaceae bacterium]|nr:MAG: hypothetical protein EOP84_30455 [Verrucomicrobiaceae bacterium]
MYIEPLEARIAPATLAIAGDQRTVTWTDVDGDLVTLKITKGTLEEGNFVCEDSGAGLVVKSLDITADEFAGASLTISAKRVVEPDNAVGNGQVDVGYINAAGHALKKVKVAGDLGRIDVGLDVLTNKRSQELLRLLN